MAAIARLCVRWPLPRRSASTARARSRCISPCPLRPQGTMRMLHFVDRLVHRPVKAGLRLPWKASTPSRKSSEERSRL